MANSSKSTKGIGNFKMATFSHLSGMYYQCHKEIVSFITTFFSKECYNYRVQRLFKLWPMMVTMPILKGFDMALTPQDFHTAIILTLILMMEQSKSEKPCR